MKVKTMSYISNSRLSEILKKQGKVNNREGRKVSDFAAFVTIHLRNGQDIPCIRLYEKSASGRFIYHRKTGQRVYLHETPAIVGYSYHRSKEGRKVRSQQYVFTSQGKTAITDRTDMVRVNG